MTAMRKLLSSSVILLLLNTRPARSEDDGSGDTQNEGFAAFPEELEPSSREEASWDAFLRLSGETDIESFMENLIKSGRSNVTLTEISARMGVENVERSASFVKAKMAHCMPELKTVSIVPVKDAASLYLPPCIRIERCGGCCLQSLLTCTPVESEIINVKVMVAEFRGGTISKAREEIVPVEKHTKCACDCVIQPEDCTKSQKYNKTNCNCECDTGDAERKCYEERDTKIWSKDRCGCLCRKELECGTGFYFDPLLCRCERNVGRRKQSHRPWIA